MTAASSWVPDLPDGAINHVSDLLSQNVDLRDVARSVRAKFGLSPAHACLAMKRAGVPYPDDKEAVDSTLSRQAGEATAKLRDELIRTIGQQD